MQDDRFPGNEFISHVNAVIDKTYGAEQDTAVALITHVVEIYSDQCPIPRECHPALEALANCARDLKVFSQFSDFMHTAAFDPEQDKSIRQSVNEICYQLSEGRDMAQIKVSMSSFFKTYMTENTIHPYADDIFRILRTLALNTNSPELLVHIDKARYFSGCLDPDTIAFSDFVGTVEVTGYGIPTFQLHSNGDCPISAVVEKKGVYEPTSMQVWASLAATAGMIVDVGAHVGFYSLLTASVNSSIPIHALEPNPEAYARLLENIRINDFGMIQCHPVACAKQDGTVEFNYIEAKTAKTISEVGSTTGRAWNSGIKISVDARCIDGLIETPPSARPLIKIDTEGKESDAVEGAMDLIRTTTPDFIIESFRQDVCDNITEALAPYGYRFFRIIEGAHELVELEQMTPAVLTSFKNYNSLVTNRSVAALKDLIVGPISIKPLS
jgi:FkbM family methyltransferase